MTTTLDTALPPPVRPWRSALVALPASPGLGFKLMMTPKWTGFPYFEAARQGRQGCRQGARRRVRLCRRRPCRRHAAGRDAPELPDPEARRDHSRGDRSQRGGAGAEAGARAGHRRDDLRRRRRRGRPRHVRQPAVLQAGRQDHARLRADGRAGGRRGRLRRRLADGAEPHGAHQVHEGIHRERPEISGLQGGRHPVRQRRRRQELRRRDQPDAGASRT